MGILFKATSGGVRFRVDFAFQLDSSFLQFFRNSNWLRMQLEEEMWKCAISLSLSGHKPGCNSFFQAVGNAVHRLTVFGHACNFALLDEGKKRRKWQFSRFWDRAVRPFIFSSSRKISQLWNPRTGLKCIYPAVLVYTLVFNF